MLQISDPKTWPNTFYEHEGWKGVKLLHMAGLYHVWRDDNMVIYSYSVITMESNETLNWLHHRMPAIVDNQDQINVSLTVVKIIFFCTKLLDSNLYIK